MDIKAGGIFTKPAEGVDFMVKKITGDEVVLESQDGKRQILIGIHTLTLTSFYLKRGEES
jgi:hypothetical protein